MFDGKPINKSENRAVLHTALRADQNKEHTPEVANKFQDINHQSQKIKMLVKKSFRQMARINQQGDH